MNRREWLAAAGLSLLLPSVAHPFGKSTLVDIAELDVPGSQSRPNAWKYLLFEVEGTTSVEVDAKVPRVAPTDPGLFEHPFVVLQGDAAFQIDDVGLEQLSRYLAYGGFLFVDDTSGASSSPFDDSVRELARRLFPTRSLGPIPRDHSLYRSFFLIDEPLGRVALHRQLEGVSVGNLSPFVYCRNDLSGALEREPTGRYVRAVVPGGERQRREALKLGVNLILYTLTANYKKDQAHIRALMQQGRLE